MAEAINCDDLVLSDWESSSSDNTQISPLEHNFPNSDISTKDNDIFSHKMNCLQESELSSQNQDTSRKGAHIFRRTEMLPYESVGGNMRDQTLSIQENSTYIFSRLGNFGSRKNVACQTCSESRQNISSHPISSKIDCFKPRGFSQPREEFDTDQLYERITSSQEMFRSQEMITSSQESFGSQRMITSSQETLDSQRMITSSQETLDSQRMVTSSQETLDSQRMVTSSQETLGNQRMVTSSQETSDSQRMITSSQETSDSQRMLTSSQETVDSQRMFTSSQETCNNHKTLSSGPENFEEITEKEVYSTGKSVPWGSENAEQVIPIDETEQSKIIKTKNSLTKALQGASSYKRSDKTAKSKIIQRDLKVMKRKSGCKKRKISARELKGNKKSREQGEWH